MSRPISRRTVLRGLGTAVALPWLESLGFAQGTAQAVAAAPKRLAFVYVPNGVNMAQWSPAETGTLGRLTGILEPLNPFKSHVNVIGGMTLDKGRANGDGPGDHARAMSTFLTGRQPRKTHGADIRVGMSADQHVANAIGDQTRFPSLELGVERGQQAGNCDSGYSCAYSSNLSWRGESTPNAKETDPKAVFERLFGAGGGGERAAARARRDADAASILDFVQDDARRLNGTLGQGDRRKLDEYLSSVREVEQRIERARATASAPPPRPNMPAPTGTPSDPKEHIRLMCDLMVLAFQTDTTRVVTLPFANDGSNRPYRFIEVPEGHHDLSHHGSDPAKLAKIAKINTFHTEQLAYLLGKMQATREANGSTLLDNVMLVYGSGLGDGNRHNHDDLPILLCGKGGGTIQAGRHLVFPKRADTPLMNLYLALFQRMGVPAASFGDSTGVLSI
ncbi:DUF1552 domain-containing protein [Urbifossiella limnaea]|uniref:DUF1552 domain-containing protein n=1 Tax=Urbifossiella limnaea TaxID=2528023 RepID=A0A517XSP6_9BACT|nr:DUF1552 domain-containing protein [Urbifossiella limnaea]QDU20513.1 hypothetical protein ETAA1_24650 [Urbifossiella limnaea]